MATQTKWLGSLIDDETHLARLGYDYDDVSLEIQTIRLENGLTHSVFASLTRTSDARVYGPVTVQAGQTIAQAMPNGAQNRLKLTLRPDGRLDGAEVQFWS